MSQCVISECVASVSDARFDTYSESQGSQLTPRNGCLLCPIPAIRPTRVANHTTHALHKLFPAKLFRCAASLHRRKTVLPTLACLLLPLSVRLRASSLGACMKMQSLGSF